MSQNLCEELLALEMSRKYLFKILKEKIGEKQKINKKIYEKNIEKQDIYFLIICDVQ